MDSEMVLLKFHAEWCSPCKALMKVLQVVLTEQEFADIVLKEINIDEDVEASRKYQIRSIPTLVLLKGDVEVARLVGNQKVDSLREFLLLNI